MGFTILFFCIVAIQCAFSFTGDIFANEVFILSLSHNNFSFPSTDVLFKPSMLNKPDLPSWLHYAYSEPSHAGYIYGTPPDINNIQLEVVALDKETYNTSRQIFDVRVHYQHCKKFEVNMKIKNLNVEDFLISYRQERLKSVFTDSLWPSSAGDIVITSLLSASHKGDRLPSNPNQKEGFYVTYGSNSPFSKKILDVEREVEPLWAHKPCPFYFKKVSSERFFSSKGFAVDYCNFKLVRNKKMSDNALDFESKPNNNNGPFTSSLEVQEPIVLQKRSEVITRSYIFDVIHTILVPFCVMVILLFLLTLAMCCHRTNMDRQSSIFFDELFDYIPRIPKPQSILMVHYNGSRKANEVLKITHTRECSPHPSVGTATTNADTVTVSHTDSPASSLRRSAVSVRRYEDYATLSRPDPPPYQRKVMLNMP